MSQALVEGSGPLVDRSGNAEQVFFVDVSDCDLEDDFVCEGDREGRGARAGFVP
jgi:hypothetical protein